MKTATKALALVALIAWADASFAQAVRWTGSWAAAQQIPEPANALPKDDLRDATLRQVVHLSLGGKQLRVHLSNAFGTGPLVITAAHVARPVAGVPGKIEASTDTAVTFGGQPGVTIPPGAEYVSDAIAFSVAPLSSLAVTIRIAEPPAQQTGHPGSRATTFLSHGDAASAIELTHPKTVEHWEMLSGVDVASSGSEFAVVALGDSITDGHAATTDKDERWTDVFAARLQGKGIGVLNLGIGGNHLLTDGLGPNALARFDRDVLAQSGARCVIVLEGINDLGALSRESATTPAQHAALVLAMEGAYEQMIVRAHARGLKVIGGTIMPFGGSDYYHPAAENEADRQQVNAWIRAAGHFDAVIDFDKAMADPQMPGHLLPAYDSGDHLHPSPAGYKAMANAIPLSLIERP